MAFCVITIEMIASNISLTERGFVKFIPLDKIVDKIWF